MFFFSISEKLNERVRSLLSQNEELERKLKWNQERLNDLAKEKGVLWLDSMLSYCKYELTKRVATCVDYIGNFMKSWCFTRPRFLL